MEMFSAHVGDKLGNWKRLETLEHANLKCRRANISMKTYRRKIQEKKETQKGELGFGIILFCFFFFPLRCYPIPGKYPRHLLFTLMGYTPEEPVNLKQALAGTEAQFWNILASCRSEFWDSQGLYLHVKNKYKSCLGKDNILDLKIALKISIFKV